MRNALGVTGVRIPSGLTRTLLRNTMIIFRVAETKHDHGWCVAIRTLVFEVEQRIDIGLEVDQHEDACRHILGIDDRIPFAAARWRVYKPGVAKIERVAVLKAWRGRNLGIALMDAVISDIKTAGSNFKTLRVEAQDYTIPFYEKMGFTVVGDGFLEANIPHHAMEKCV
jgi:predicted GNAT family N-acyltransferase